MATDKKKFYIGSAAALGALLVLSACGGGGSSAKESFGAVAMPALKSMQAPSNPVLPAGNGQAKCPADTTIAYVGLVTGESAALGKNQIQGAQLAINEHNRANPDCQVKFQKFDTEGIPDKGPGPATQAVANKNVIAVLGPSFSGVTLAVGKIFSDAGLAAITGSATNPVLSTKGWTTFFRAQGNDSVQAPGAVQLMIDHLKAKKVYVINDDGSYGKTLGDLVYEDLKPDERAGRDQTLGTQKDFSATVAKVISSKADAVYYGGYYAAAAPLLNQLRNQGYKGYFVSDDGVKDDQLIKLAGNNSNNTYFTCPCADGSLIPSFEKDYKAAYGSNPGTYSVDYYDMATIVLTGIDKGNLTRPEMLKYVRDYDADGVSKHYKFSATGELLDPEVYFYRVDGDKIITVGKASLKK